MPTAIEFGRFLIRPHRPEVLAECRPMENRQARVREACGWRCEALRLIAANNCADS
jgi:hypothetical protein